MNQSALHRVLISKSLKKSIDRPEDLFQLRLATNLSLISSLFFSLYPKEKNEVFFHRLLVRMEQLFANRSSSLKMMDLERLEAGNWYQSEQLVGMQLYVDRFNKDIKGLQKKTALF